MTLPRSTFNYLLSQLPQLSAAQAMQVRERLSFLNGLVETTDDTSHWLLDGAYAELRRRGLMSNSRPPYNILKSWSKSLPIQLQGIEAFLLKSVGRSLNPAEKAALAQVCFAALCDWLIERRLTPSLRMVILNLGNVPVALDAAFPGYAAVGLLGRVFEAKGSSFKKMDRV
jgi:hypothetical protein